MDTNGDLDMIDAFVTLTSLLQGTQAPSCLDAADVDDTGDLDLTDAVYLLSYLCLGGPEPLGPFDARGSDPTADGLSCFRDLPAGG